VHILNNVSGSIGSVLRPAGFENSKDILSTAYFKDQTDPANARIRSGGMDRLHDKYYPEGDKTNSSNVSAYTTARLLVQVLQQCAIISRART
jgi:branched-chain amino acid transport system substrate-binding protein